MCILFFDNVPFSSGSRTLFSQGCKNYKNLALTTNGTRRTVGWVGGGWGGGWKGRLGGVGMKEEGLGCGADL
jgi:hypothetical protein